MTLGPELSRTYQLGCDTKVRHQAVQLGLGEKIDAYKLLRRDGQIQANDQDIVSATPVWIFLGREIFV